jgi:hypothetical protein
MSTKTAFLATTRCCYEVLPQASYPVKHVILSFLNTNVLKVPPKRILIAISNI